MPKRKGVLPKVGVSTVNVAHEQVQMIAHEQYAVELHLVLAQRIDEQVHADVADGRRGLKAKFTVVSLLRNFENGTRANGNWTGHDRLSARPWSQFAKMTLGLSGGLSGGLLELEALCDHVIFIERGQCTREGSIVDVTEQGLVMRYHIERAVGLEALTAAQPELEMTWEAKTLIVRGTGNWTPSRLNAAVVPYLLGSDAGLLEIRRGQSLEDARTWRVGLMGRRDVSAGWGNRLVRRRRATLAGGIESRSHDERHGGSATSHSTGKKACMLFQSGQ